MNCTTIFRSIFFSPRPKIHKMLRTFWHHFFKTANNSIHCWQIVFRDRRISRALWSLLTPHLNPCKFYFWGLFCERQFSHRRSGGGGDKAFQMQHLLFHHNIDVHKRVLCDAHTDPKGNFFQHSFDMVSETLILYFIFCAIRFNYHTVNQQMHTICQNHKPETCRSWCIITFLWFWRTVCICSFTMWYLKP